MADFSLQRIVCNLEIC